MKQSHENANRSRSECDQLPSDWRRTIAKFQKPRIRASSIQLLNTLVPYVGLWVLMYFTLGISIWLTLGLSVLAGAFLIRVFIIFHDCGHGAFLPSRKANNFVGFVTGVLVFTPYHHWRWEHARHHATSGDLDKRGIGDVWTMTVAEYLAAPKWKRIAYRLVRHPAVLLLVAPLVLFLVIHRFSISEAGPRERRSVHLTNLCLLLMAAGLSLLFGVGTYLIIQLVVMGVAASAGVWLFYVQHQFEGVYWERSEDWDFATAAIKGSSFYRLPKVLQWFSGNIGFHHVHHLSSRIPNYNLEACHEAEPFFKSVKPLTLRASLRSLSFRLWDEDRCRLIGFGQLKEVERQRPDSSKTDPRPSPQKRHQHAAGSRKTRYRRKNERHAADRPGA